MKKIIWLVLVCALAVLISLWVIANPGVVAFFIRDTLIKLPLWLFVILVVALFCVLGLLYHLLRFVLLSPRQWWQGLRVRRHDRLTYKLVEMQKAYLLRDHHLLEKKYTLAKLNMPVIGDGLVMLYWQGLLAQGKYQELQSILQTSSKANKKTFVWRYYQAMVFYKVEAFEEAMPLLSVLIKDFPNSIEIVEALINCQLAEKRIIDAKDNLLKHQRILSSSTIDNVFKQLFTHAISLRDLNEIWQSVPRIHNLSLSAEYAYFNRLYSLLQQDEFKERMQKRLLVSLDKELISLYLDLAKDNAAYEFVRSCWLKQNKQDDQSLNILIISLALIYQDDAFVAENLHKVHQSALTISEQLKYLLAKERLAYKQSMPNQAQKYRVLREQLLLESL
ncbi:heme biosynthesis HemY N-terminal domain-containing protein [Cysteiniphilum halobium]|uniref:heme biosynthesis HemY N-terminal domain-containing protein n=1 Tax=Cysteiniphilum halobium TaxID=2219059 RepID=UPI000E647D70|nr:heme biosynthesis HemY N-terminal domain-containing protein [Cysteiniphilum halobium]